MTLRAPNRISRRVCDKNPVQGVAQIRQPVRARADKAALDAVAAISGQDDPVKAESVDRETAQGAATGGNTQPVCGGPRSAAVQLDDRSSGKIGRGEFGAIERGPAPAMSNAIVSRPAFALAAFIASRKLP